MRSKEFSKVKDFPKRRDIDDYVHIAVGSDEDNHENVGAFVVSSLETEEGCLWTQVIVITCVRVTNTL